MDYLQLNRLPWGYHLTYSLLLAFFAILFLQSGMDKVTDRKGNLDWLSGHFSKSPLAGMVPMLLSLLTGLELVAGGLSLLCIVLVWVVGPGGFWLPYATAMIGMVTLLALFFGQRMAKDYAGAVGIVPYFIVGLINVLMSIAYLS